MGNKKKSLTDLERDGMVDQFLHYAEHAENGAWFAERMNDKESADSLRDKAKRLRGEAHTIDPNHAAPAWEDDGEWQKDFTI